MRLSKSIKASIDESVLCWLATADKEGFPNVSPKEMFTYDDTDCVVLANIASPGTIKNIRTNPQVCISFVHIFRQKGYQLKGRAEIITKKDSRFESKAKNLIKMAGDLFPFYSLISVRVETAKPILAPSYILYPDTTEQQQIEAAMKTYGVRSG